jgi:hypothetical protein
VRRPSRPSSVPHRRRDERRARTQRRRDKRRVQHLTVRKRAKGPAPHGAETSEGSRTSRCGTLASHLHECRPNTSLAEISPLRSR